MPPPESQASGKNRYLLFCARPCTSSRPVGAKVSDQATGNRLHKGELGELDLHLPKTTTIGESATWGLELFKDEENTYGDAVRSGFWVAQQYRT